MCINCEQEDVEKTFLIQGRGYGSLFDLTDFKIELCGRCIKKLKIKDKWFNEEPNWSGEYYEYTYEDEIMNLLGELSNTPIILDRTICC